MPPGPQVPRGPFPASCFLRCQRSEARRLVYLLFPMFIHPPPCFLVPSVRGKEETRWACLCSDPTQVLVLFASSGSYSFVHFPVSASTRIETCSFSFSIRCLVCFSVVLSSCMCLYSVYTEADFPWKRPMFGEVKCEGVVGHAGRCICLCSSEFRVSFLLSIMFCEMVSSFDFFFSLLFLGVSERV